MKVVINSCHGGFGLSSKAQKAYCDRKGIPCNFFWRKDLSGPYKRITDEEAFADTSMLHVSAFRCETPEEIPSQDNWREMTHEERVASNKRRAEISVPYHRDIARDDHDLIAVVDSMGSAANGLCAKLEVVEIPDGIGWQIEEYDGLEWVSETHRTWS